MIKADNVQIDISHISVWAPCWRCGWHWAMEGMAWVQFISRAEFFFLDHVGDFQGSPPRPVILFNYYLRVISGGRAGNVRVIVTILVVVLIIRVDVILTRLIVFTIVIIVKALIITHFRDVVSVTIVIKYQLPPSVCSYGSLIPLEKRRSN